MIIMKFVVRPLHILALGGYIIEWDFPYRNIIVVNKTEEPIKVEVPVFNEEWIEEHRALGLKIVPVSREDNFLKLYKKAYHDLEKIRS